MPSEKQKLQSGDEKTDLFYPRGYVIAGFANMENAQRAKQAARDAGFSEDDVVLLKPHEVLAERNKDKREESDSIVVKFQNFLSNMGDDSNYVEQYTDLARKGYAFLLIHAPEQAETDRARDAIQPFKPERARKYDQMQVIDLYPQSSGM